jgi:hypothetical protein
MNRNLINYAVVENKFLLSESPEAIQQQPSIFCLNSDLVTTVLMDFGKFPPKQIAFLKK